MEYYFGDIFLLNIFLDEFWSVSFFWSYRLRNKWLDMVNLMKSSDNSDSSLEEKVVVNIADTVLDRWRYNWYCHQEHIYCHQGVTVGVGLLIYWYTFHLDLSTKYINTTPIGCTKACSFLYAHCIIHCIIYNNCILVMYIATKVSH